MIRILLLVFLFCFSLPAFSSGKILIIGDSISAGYGLQPGEGWVDLLQQKLQQQNYEYEVINDSISGDTTQGGAQRIRNAVTRYKPNIVVIELGGNDGLRGLDLGQMRKNLSSMIEISQSQQAKVLLIGMQLPPNYGPAYTRKFSQIYESLAQEKNTALLPFLLKGIENNLSYFQADRIHPNAMAQTKLLENVWPTLVILLQVLAKHFPVI